MYLFIEVLNNVNLDIIVSNISCFNFINNTSNYKGIKFIQKDKVLYTLNF